jgi:hypothetical protein
MPEADMATKSIDQGWQPPPIKWKCREWLRRDMYEGAWQQRSLRAFVVKVEPRR